MMTEIERLLVLDAALSASEGVFANHPNIPTLTRIHSNLHGLINSVVKELIAAGQLPWDFDKYLEVQKLALVKLIENPQLFGGE
jgi:hypothetical protein